MLHLNLLGPLVVGAEDGRQVALVSRKEEALLAYLATEHSHAHSRESLMGLLWPDFPEQKARLNLRVNFFNLRKHLKPIGGDVLFDATILDIRFRVDDCRVDLVTFVRGLHSGDGHPHRREELCEQCAPSVAYAVGLYRGIFLDGLFVDGCLAYEEWLFMQRERFRVLHLDALEKLTSYHLRRDEVDEALGYARRQLDVDPLREGAHQQIMQIHLAQGNRTEALRAYERCRTVLREELGLEPSIEIRELYQQIQTTRTMHSVNSPSSEPTPRRAVQTQLPVYLTPFVGRQDELNLLSERIQEGTYRLISLVGAGGMGKSRLAVETARRLVEHFADGVIFVPLASVRPSDAAGDSQAVADTVATALRVVFGGDQRHPQDRLIEWLRTRHQLLVLDNFEHLLSAAPLLLAILHAAPQVTLLITSRERLNVQAEDVIRLAGLPVPATDDLDAVGDAASVRLFVDRAYRVDKSFYLSADNAADVAQICRLLEGRPLGIELAAAQTAHRPCRAIAENIRADLDFLSVEMADFPARHRSLRAVFEQSWQALTAAEQSGFSRLSIFRNAFTVEAAIAVAGASLPVLTRLQNTHLIERHDDGERFTIHELLRQFAADKLTASLPDPSSLQRRHADYFLTWLSGQAHILAGVRPMQVAGAIQYVIDDVRMAWQWTSSAQDASLLARALPVLSAFYALRAMHATCTQAFQATLMQIPEEETQLRAHLLARLAASLEREGKGEAAWAAAQQGLDLALGLGDYEVAALCRLFMARVFSYNNSVTESLKTLNEGLADLPTGVGPIARTDMLILKGKLEEDSGNDPGAIAAYNEAHRLVAQTGNKVQEQRLLLYRGLNLIDKDEVAARRLVEQTLTLCPETGDRSLESRILNALGYLLARIGRYEEAIEYQLRGLEICRADQEAIQQSHALHNLCVDCFGLGDYDRAYQYGAEALSIADRNGLVEGIAFAQLHLGHVLAAMHRYHEAKQAFVSAKDAFSQLHLNASVVESDAGLAYVEHLLGDQSAALAHVDAVYPHLMRTPLPALDELGRVYAHCYQVLATANDSRAQDLLTAAYRYIQSRAARLDPEDRERFLSAVPANQAILAAWEEMHRM